jgi:hypothetical protein
VRQVSVRQAAPIVRAQWLRNVGNQVTLFIQSQYAAYSKEP